MARFRSLTLRTRIVLVVVALLVAGVWGLAVRVTAVMQRDLEQQLWGQLSATIRFVTDDMDRDVDTRFQALMRIADAMPPDILHSPRKLQDYLEGRGILRDIFSMNLMVLDRSGIVMADYPLVSERLGRDLSDRPYFREVITSGKALIGSPVTGRLSQRSFVPIAVPLRDASGAVASVLVDRVVLADAHPFAQLQEVRLGTGWFIVVSPGERLIVAATDKKRLMTRLPPHGAIRLLDQRLEEGYEDVGITVASIGAEVLSVSRKMASTGWVVIAAVPTAEIFAPIESLKRQIYLAALLISLLIAAVLQVFLVRLGGRLDRFAQAMRRMTEGDSRLTALPVAADDEIGRVVQSFNELAAQRNRLDEALRDEIAVRKKAQQELDHAMTRLRLLSERLTRDREEERHEVSFELHEELGQELTALNLHLQMLEPYCTRNEAKAQLQNARSLARLMVERVRNMAGDLRPAQLDDFGLYAAVHTLCAEQARAAGWVMHFEAPGEAQRPDHDVEITCFRLVQEALTNIARHAQASEVWVSLRRGPEEFTLSVRDNGVGFDAAAIHDRAGREQLGLAEIEERVRQVCGRVEVESHPGHGTEIRAMFRLCSAFPDELCQPVASAECAACRLNPAEL